MLENKNKMCAFYASDYHFEMIILPYLNRKIEENNNILIFTENNLNETINVLMERINLKEKNKEKILNLNWNNNDLEKFENLKEYEKESKKTLVFIKGTKNYIKNINQNIDDESKKSGFKIIDCYRIEDINGNMNTITCNYKMILNTTGEAKINNN